MLESLKINRLILAIAIIWLFHISAIIGISIGYVDWFVEKTPLNLSITLFLFLIIYPINNIKKTAIFIFICLGGLFAEWLGVEHEILFGEYAYGNNFGPKLEGVPYLIGAYWAILTFVTAGIMDYTRWSNIIKIILAANLMVVLDFLMEHTAPIFDFWTFEGGYPTLENYLTWFILGVAFHIILRLFSISGEKQLSAHIYLSQFVFFLFFYFFFP